MRAVAVFLLAAAIGQAQPPTPSIGSPQDSTAHDSLFASALRAGNLSAFTVCLACGTISRATDGKCAKCGRPLLNDAGTSAQLAGTLPPNALPSDRGARFALHGLGRFHLISGLIGMVGASLWIAGAAVAARSEGWDEDSRLGFVAPCGFAFMAMWEFGLGAKLLSTPAK